jgi:hypothetical protein
MTDYQSGYKLGEGLASFLRALGYPAISRVKIYAEINHALLRTIDQQPRSCAYNSGFVAGMNDTSAWLRGDD